MFYTPDVLPESLSAVLPSGAHASWMSPLTDDLPLHPDEAAHLGLVAHRRRREFSVGRHLARQLLGELGESPHPLLSGSGREPLWPTGIVGSISHTSSGCLVVVGRDSAFRSIGVDIETPDFLEADLWPEICTESELSLIEGQLLLPAGLCAKHLFCAKEAVYKFQYPVTGAFLEFHDVELLIDLERGSFAARSRCDKVRDVIDAAIGKFALVEGHIVALVFASSSQRVDPPARAGN